MPSDDACYRHWGRLSHLGKEQLAAHLGDGQAAEAVRKAEWDAQDAAEEAAREPLRKAMSQLRHVEQHIPSQDVSKFDSVKWSADLSKAARRGSNASISTDASATIVRSAVHELLSSLKHGPRRRIENDVSIDIAATLSSLQKVSGGRLVRDLISCIEKLHDGLGIESARHSKHSRARGHCRTITAEDTSQETWKKQARDAHERSKDGFIASTVDLDTMRDEWTRGRTAPPARRDQISAHEARLLAWHAPTLPRGPQLAEAALYELRASEQLPMADRTAAVPASGLLEWRCNDYFLSTTAMNCVLQSFTWIVAAGLHDLVPAATARTLEVMCANGLHFSDLQRVFDTLIDTDAAAGALLLKHAFWRGFDVLHATSGCYIFGGYLDKLNGTVLPHAMAYNADTKLLCLGTAVKPLLAEDLADIPALVEKLRLDHGVFCEGVSDTRQIMFRPKHPGAVKLRYAAEMAAPPPRLSSGARRRERKKVAAAAKRAAANEAAAGEAAAEEAAAEEAVAA